MARKGAVGRAGARRAALVCALCVVLTAGSARADGAAPTLEEVFAAGRGADLDERTLVDLVRAAGDDASPIVADLLEQDDPAAVALRARVLRALPAALGAPGERLLVAIAVGHHPVAARLDALAALAATGGPDALTSLFTLLDAPDDAIREAAVLALTGVAGRADDPTRRAVVAALRDLITRAGRTEATAQEARRAAGALAALVALRPDAADLVAALSHPRVEVRAAALAALGRAESVAPEERAAVTAALLSALAAAPARRPGAVDEKGLALAALPVWGAPATCILPVLEAIEADPGCEVPGLAALRRIVGRDMGDVAAWWRLWARGASDWRGLDVHLATLDAGDTDAVVRALGTLANLPDPRTFEAIERLVRRLDAADAWALGWGDAQAVAACRALGALRDRRGVAPLRVVLAAPRASDEARGEAHLALMRITGRTGPMHADAWRDAAPAPPRRPAPGEAWRAALAPLPVTPTPPRGGLAASDRRLLAVRTGAAPAQPSPRPVDSRWPLMLWPLAGALLTAYGLWLAWRRRRGDDDEPQPASALAGVPAGASDALIDASTAAALALRSLEDANVPSLRRSGAERRRFTAPPSFDGVTGRLRRTTDEAAPDPLGDLDGDHDADGDGVVHVVLGQAPRWRAPTPAPTPAPAPAPVAPVAPEDAAWREALEAMDEIAPSVTRAWARVSAEDSWHERVVFDASAGRGTLRQAIMNLRAGASREQIEALEVELAGGVRLPLYRRREARPPEDEAGEPPLDGPATCVDDPAWRGLLTALTEMGDPVEAVWARLEGGGAAETLWTRERAGGLAAAAAALTEVRPRVTQAGVRLAGSPADLVLFDAQAPGRRDDDGAAAAVAHEAGFAGTIEALRAMGDSVRKVATRLSIDAEGAPPRVLFPAEECRDLEEALAALESLEPVVVDVRARLLGAEADLVLLDRAADGARARSASRALRPVEANAWEDLVRAIEELGPQLEHVVVRGSDGEDLVVFADDEGGVPSLVDGLRGLKGLIVHVRVRIVGVETELVLLDTPVAAPRPSTFRDLVGGSTSVVRCLAA